MLIHNTLKIVKLGPAYLLASFPANTVVERHVAPGWNRSHIVLLATPDWFLGTVCY